MYNLILAQAAAGKSGGILGMVIPFALMFVVFYFFIIRPQAKKQKEHEAMLSNLSVKDKVVTTSGIIGIITRINPDKNTVVLKVDKDNETCIEFQRHTIVGKLNND